MAVVRQNIGAQIKAPNATPVRGSGAGAAAPKPVYQGDAGGVLPLATQGASASDLYRMNQKSNRAVSILNYGIDAAQKWADREKEEAYLSGVAAKEAGLSQDQLDSDPLTAHWAEAGYKDTVGRLAMANQQAQIARDMPKLREKSPQAMLAYLNDSRKKLMPVLNSMSYTARKQLVPQILANDQAALRAHNAAHTKYIIEKTTEGIQTGMATQVAAMQGVKDDPQAYLTSVQATAGFLYGNVVNNPTLPYKTKQKLLSEGAAYAINSENPALYDFLTNQDVKLPDGSKGPMIGMLDMGDQNKLAEAHRKALGAVAVYQHSNLLQEQAALEAQLSDPKAPPVDTAKAIALGNQLRAAGILNTPEKYKSFYQKLYKHQMVKSGGTELATQFMNNDQRGMVAAGYTEAQGGKAFATMVAKLPVDQQVNSYIGAISNGSPTAPKLMAKNLIAPIIGSLGVGTAVREDNAKVLGRVADYVQKQVDTGNRALPAQIMAGMEPAQARAFNTYLSSFRTYGDPMQAANAARDEMTETAKNTAGNAPGTGGLTLTQARARAGQFAGIGYLHRAGRTVVGFGMGLVGAGQDYRNATAAMPVDSVGNDQIAARNNSRLTKALGESIYHASLDSPGLSGDALDNAGLADVLRRQIDTTNGPLYLPYGSKASAVFGTDPSISNETIGQAISTLTESMQATREDGAHIMWRVNSSGTLTWDAFKPDTARPVQEGTLPASAVRDTIKELDEAQAKKGSQWFGPGTKKFGIGANKDTYVQYNGENTAGLNPSEAYAIRTQLIAHEGVTDTAYKDAAGNQTNGVGISLSAHPEAPTGSKWTPTEISRTFSKASSHAMKLMTQAMVTTPVRVSPLHQLDYKQLLTDIAYHQGNLSGEALKMQQALQRGDLPAAEAALKATPAYKWSGTTRQSWMLSRLKAAQVPIGAGLTRFGAVR